MFPKKTQKYKNFSQISKSFFSKFYFEFLMLIKILKPFNKIT